MTNFLIKRFVRDGENVRDSKVRTAYGTLASFVGVLSNVVLFIVKLVVGLTLGSVAVIADSFNNLSDSASSIITFIGFKMGSKPADEQHPFGHGRFEYISALVVSFFIMLMGYEFFKASIDKILHPAIGESFDLFTLAILTLTIFIKLWLSAFNKKIAKKINSKSLEATAMDARNDVIVTIVTIFSVTVSRLTGFDIDGYTGMIVAIVLFKSGIDIARETLSPLLGESTDPELADKIKGTIEKYNGIIGTHDLVVHSYGPNLSMASIHAEVPNNIDIAVSHETIDSAEREIADSLGINIVIHMDPVEVNDERIVKLSTIVNETLAGIDKLLSAHDFRIVDCDKQVNVIFDLLVPHSYQNEMRRTVVKKLQQSIAELDKRYFCIINVESGFVATK